MFRRTKLTTDGNASWDEAFRLYRGQLRFYLDYLIECGCSESILSCVEADVTGTWVPDEFKLRYLVRFLVRRAIRHLRECHRCDEGSTRPAEGSSWSSFPTEERIVYFLRDILEYSRRDTSLLVGVSDAQVDRLLSLARKRLDIGEGPSSLEFQAPTWTSFRWKFENLHLR